MKKVLTALLLSTALAHAQENVSYGRPCNSQVASCQLKSAAGNLLDFQVNNWSISTAVTVMLLDTTTVPGSGATVAPVKFWGLPIASSAASPSGIGVSWIPDRLIFTTGILILCSTTGPTIYTPSSTCTMSGATQ